MPTRFQRTKSFYIPTAACEGLVLSIAIVQNSFYILGGWYEHMKGLSNRLGGQGSRRTSTVGEILRGTGPTWIQHLVDSGMSSSEEKKLLTSVGECTLCHTPLKTLRDMEPANKKICRVCKAVICRQCAAHVHLLGHVRRKYACFKCVGRACVKSELVEPIVVEKVPDATLSPAPSLQNRADSMDQAIEQNQGTLTALVTRLWDAWSGWNGVGDEAISEGEEDMETLTRATASTGAQVEAVDMPNAEERISEGGEVLDGGMFDGDQLKMLLQKSHGFKGDRTLVLSIPFTKACCEVIKLMSGLGRVFEFAGNDMNEKLAIMGKRCKETASESQVPPEEVTIQMMVEREIKAKTTHAGKKAQGASRTVVRLLWFMDFIATLLKKLAKEPKEPLNKILGATYEESLAPRHVWILKRMIRSGIASMVPEKKVFLPKLGVENLSESEQCEKFVSWAGSVDAVRLDLWHFMESKGLSEIP